MIALSSLSTSTGTFVSVRPVVRAMVLAVLTSFIVQHVSNEGRVSSGAIFSGIFDLLAIFTAFLATFYTFVVTKGNEFLKGIQKTRTYPLILRLLKFTIVWSSAMILFSYVMMVYNPKNYLPFSWPHAVVFF